MTTGRINQVESIDDYARRANVATTNGIARPALRQSVLKRQPSGPHARYTDVFNESIALADRPGKRESSARVDYVPALCTHRPSLLPIEWSGEVFGLRRRGRFAAGDVVRSPLNLII
ncbi:hypothetical protein RIF29_02614 [Crotalaria pallida]|uniref:Uncharacterized protein n=1 Tax=Crotalaria pallida TaxID=3830 RepID=A0AAN9IZ12_CROPI